ncbi:unnamed protein product [marine sediment metagenome]|uniref:ArnR1-like winged helix-turn-helix domain-containing protein n=1 Tax=marine sediment metagenome TaxID=412755 RepID=X1K2R5_9ZZZZ
MNANRRNNLDICADILRIAQGGARKTKIVYGANLNFKIIKGYLKELIQSELLLHDPPNYYATPKGVTYLTKFEQLLED